MFIGQEEHESVFEAYSQDSLVTKFNSIKNGQCEDNNRNDTKNNTGSIILAGNFARQQSDSFETIQGNYLDTYRDGQLASKDMLIVSDETSYIPLKHDLNKCINLFHNEYLKEHDVSNKYSNLSSSLSKLRISNDIELNQNNSPIVQLIKDCRRSMSSDSLKSTTIPSNAEIRKCKSCTMLNNNLRRDTNNIKSDKLFSTETATKSNQDRVDLRFVSLYDQFSPPQTPILQKKSEKCQVPDSTESSEKSSKEELDPSELRAFLRSLDKKPKQEHFLRRLSVTYYNSPKHFTEKLLTIVEESTESRTNVSLCRILEDFQKCNCIEDETAPEWLHSSPAMSTPICMRKGSQEFKRDFLRKSLGATTPNKDLYLATPPRFNSPNKLYRRPKSILHNVESPLLDNTSTFESLEAYCEKLYPNEYKTLAAAEKNQWQSPFRNKNKILRACENQMASLDNSPNIREQLKQARRSSLDSSKQCNTVPEALCRLLSYEHKTDSKSVPDIHKQRTKHNKHCENLRHSLIHEIVKKRQKCINDVKMMESDMDLEKAEETCQITTNGECNSSTINNDSKFIKTLECVKKYQDYLEQYKPLLNLLQQSESYSSHTHDKRDTPTKKIFNKNINTNITASSNKATLQVAKSSSKTRKKSASPSLLKPSSTNKMISSKPKLFYTPGKTTPQAVVKNCKPKRTYFPNLLNSPNKQKENISPHEKNIYRQIGTYDYVKSPVGSYIRGTDLPHLVKNLRPKTNENLLTPRKKKANRSPSPNPKMNFRLSPKKVNEQ